MFPLSAIIDKSLRTGVWACYWIVLVVDTIFLLLSLLSHCDAAALFRRTVFIFRFEAEESVEPDAANLAAFRPEDEYLFFGFTTSSGEQAFFTGVKWSNIFVLPTISAFWFLREFKQLSFSYYCTISGRSLGSSGSQRIVYSWISISSWTGWRPWLVFYR